MPDILPWPVGTSSIIVLVAIEYLVSVHRMSLVLVKARCTIQSETFSSFMEAAASFFKGAKKVEFHKGKAS